MKAVFVCFILLINTFSFSQESDSRAEFEYGFFAFGNLNYRYLRNYEDRFGFNDQVIESRNLYEKHSIRGAIGFSLTRNFTNGMFLESGIAYSNMGYNYEDKFFLIQSNNTVTEVLFKEKRYHHYLEIPTQFGMTVFRKNDNTIRARAGINHNFLLISNGKAILIYEDGREVSTNSSDLEDYNTYNPQVIFGFDYGWTMANRPNWGFKVGPEILFSLRPIADAPIREYLYSFGVRFSALWLNAS